MSTFGNKALIWWDYHTRGRDALLRFNSTPKDIQLQILQKWYPIGMKIGLGDGRYNYEISEHTEHMTFWNVKVVLKAESSIMNNMSSNRNPLALFPDPLWEKQIKRQQKITRLV